MLQQIGAWRDSSHPAYPDPADLVDPGWDWLERGAVLRYLERGTIMSSGVELELCQFCDALIHGDRLTNGRFVWPAALRHYVQEHAVRLPQELLDAATDPDTALPMGYWRERGANDGRPDPRDLVDHGWSRRERRRVGDYLDRGSVVAAWFGYDDCRICGVSNGDCDLGDGAYMWPSGLRHYLDAHAVRLPQSFVDHVDQRIHEIEAPADVAWWLATTRA